MYEVLVGDVDDDLIFRGVKDIMNTNQSFNVAEIGSYVSSYCGGVVNDGGSHLFSQIFEVVDTERFDVLW